MGWLGNSALLGCNDLAGSDLTSGKIGRRRESPEPKPGASAGGGAAQASRVRELLTNIQ